MINESSFEYKKYGAIQMCPFFQFFFQKNCAPKKILECKQTAKEVKTSRLTSQQGNYNDHEKYNIPHSTIYVYVMDFQEKTLQPSDKMIIEESKDKIKFSSSVIVEFDGEVSR